MALLGFPCTHALGTGPEGSGNPCQSLPPPRGGEREGLVGMPSPDSLSSERNKGARVVKGHPGPERGGCLDI